jgi:16S rRNA (guanine527-N7)-methyltransferase
MAAPEDANLLVVLEESRRLGFLGPGPVEDHVLHSKGFLIPMGDMEPSFEALDLGSGGGLPGLVLALSLPSSKWTLLDANERRTDFLRKAASDLGLGSRVQIVRARAEVAGRDERLRSVFSLVTSRSFGPPAVVAECAAPFLRRRTVAGRRTG